MTATLDAALGATHYAVFVHFLSLLIIGSVAGRLLAQRPLCAWTYSLAMMGVCGAWLGAEVARLFRWGEDGGAYGFIAAAVGAWALADAWRRMHRPARDRDAVVAIDRPDA